MIKWGIIGAGRIAHLFAESLKYSKTGELYAVGSRSLEKAEEFAGKYGVGKSYGSYEDLLRDPEVNAIYVATPHSFHKENTLLCLNHGKHVLCEKPFAINHAESLEMINLAKEKGLFLMEAFWSRYIPGLIEARSIIQSGKIGKVTDCEASFVLDHDGDVEDRLLNKKLGGGALLDMGVYPINITQWLLGTISLKDQKAVIGKTGVDIDDDLITSYESGARGKLHFDMHTPFEAKGKFIGTEGTLEIVSPLFKPQELIITQDGKSQHLKYPFDGPGYQFEADHFAECLEKGLLESPEMTHEETLQIMKFMDDTRAKWGLVYPGEE
ncbi:Gfo/Idh/MocA family protein [Spirochaeta cellobiosiphila]|uniref:Gfo/Idh/MocA family protein n=1 Tax=Spirochaeta cellobiosiphila TaxID=504483 RepID=UPI0004189C2C|nr:Gfo/Idh/MocA family oxidoreductase [Spirochaeta cellobiosiphila]